MTACGRSGKVHCTWHAPHHHHLPLSQFEASKALRGDLRFTSVEKIDDRVDDLRHKHSTESMSLQAEKALMKEITDLRSQRSVRAMPALCH